jgi:hypothetical protein
MKIINVLDLLELGCERSAGDKEEGVIKLWPRELLLGDQFGRGEVTIGNIFVCNKIS